MIFRRTDDPDRRRTHNDEGHWCAVGGVDMVRGKVEWEVFESGRRELDFSVRDVDVPDGSLAELVWRDRVLMTLELRRGRARREVDTTEGFDVPWLQDEEVSLRVNGIVLATATITPD